MQLTAPFALLLILALPVVVVLGWPARGFSQRREIASLLIRLFIALLLILSLAGLEISRRTESLAAVFLIDVSGSMPLAAKAASFDYTQRALVEMGPEDQAAIILFGGDALVERPMSMSRKLGTFSSIPNTSQTDLAEAIRLGFAIYPPNTARRMLILSDGTTTTGDARTAAQLANATGVEIVAVPFIYTLGDEVLITEVESPNKLIVGENFYLRITIQTNEPTIAGLRILAKGEIVYEGTQELDRGMQSLSIPLTAGEPGFTNFVVQISPQNDEFYQNNELASFSQVYGPPKILLVAPPEGQNMPFVSHGASGETRPNEFSHLLDALHTSGFGAEIVPPSGFPSELAKLSDYASVILVDVPARELSQRQMRALQSFVRDIGGGFIAIGGPTSYGVGGYFRTPLEEILPTEMEIKDEERRPNLTMVFIIDHSSSMSELSGGVTKLDLAKKAAARSIELLFPTDRVGVVALDESASWVVPITDLSNPKEVLDSISIIRSGGGTDIFAGL